MIRRRLPPAIGFAWLFVLSLGCSGSTTSESAGDEVASEVSESASGEVSDDVSGEASDDVSTLGPASDAEATEVRDDATDDGSPTGFEEVAGGGDTSDDDDTTDDTGATGDASDCPAECFDDSPCTVDGCALDGSCLGDIAALGTVCPQGVCDAVGACVVCVNDQESQGLDAGCPAGAPMCDGGNRCGACLDDGDCAAGLACDPVDLVCTNCETDSQCDDHLACTTGACTDGVCGHIGDDTVCDDGLYCTGVERCEPLTVGANADGCVAGDPERNDAVGCTVDTCDEDLDVMVHTPDDARCASDNPCVTSACSPVAGCVDTAVASSVTCAYGTNVCAAGVCSDCIDAGAGTDPGCGGRAPFCVSGACVACALDEDCGGELTCVAGSCVGCTVDTQCDDGVACTLDVCDLDTTACVSLAVDALCEDDLYCNGLERCLPESTFANAAGCVATDVPVVDDGIACTLDACDDASDAVVHVPDRELCDDALVCTFESCDVVLGCQHLALTGQGPCDGEVGTCTAEGTCGQCADTVVGAQDAGCHPGAPSCVDGMCTVCTTESDGCPLDCAGVPDGASRVDLCGTCDDNSANDCLESCGGLPCGEACDGTIAGECDDDNPCTADACVTGHCAHDSAAHDGAPCADDTVCTTTTICSAGACVATEQLACDGPCDRGTCNPALGCDHFEKGHVCDDGSGWTSGEACTATGVCLGRCDDGDPCTIDHPAAAGSGVACTGAPTRVADGTEIAPPSGGAAPCTTWRCGAAGLVFSNIDIACMQCAAEACDGPCYTGACLPTGGCEPKPSGASCDDGEASTIADVCDGNGRCGGECPVTECGQPVQVLGACVGVFELESQTTCADDDNPCTTPYCSGSGECTLRVDVGASCAHACGVGVCASDASCQLAEDQCKSKLGPCWQNAACDLKANVCDGIPNDPYCREPGAVCDPDYHFCRGDGVVCGDGVCEGDEQWVYYYRPDGSWWAASHSCGGCPEDCKSDLRCTETVRSTKFHSVFQGGASSAYGYQPPHQNQTISRMLSDDIRWFHQRIDYCDLGATQGELCLCEGEGKCPLAPVRLSVMLGEIGDFLATHDTIVVMQFDSSWVGGADLRKAFEQAGLEQYLYNRVNHEGTLEPWDLSLRTMLNKGLKLIVFGPGFLSTDNLFYAVQPYLQQVDPDAPDLYTSDILFGNGTVSNDYKVFDCADRSGKGPISPSDPRLFVLRHVYSPLPTWDLTACYNAQWYWHYWTCPSEWWFDSSLERANAILTNYYNSSRGVWYMSDDWSRYPDSCPREIDKCKSDADCTASNSSCSAFGNCVTCTENADCEGEEWCDKQLRACRQPLPDGAVCEGNLQCASKRCKLVCVSCSEDVDCDAGQFCDFLGACRTKRDLGSVCTKDNQCSSDVCFTGTCGRSPYMCSFTVTLVDAFESTIGPYRSVVTAGGVASRIAQHGAAA